MSRRADGTAPWFRPAPKRAADDRSVYSYLPGKGTLRWATMPREWVEEARRRRRLAE